MGRRCDGALMSEKHATHMPTSDLDVAKKELEMTMSKSDVAWLIEKPQHARPESPPVYWGYEEGEEGWTADIKQAIRFDTQKEADRRAAYCGVLEHVSVEHAWQPARPRS